MTDVEMLFKLLHVIDVAHAAEIERLRAAALDKDKEWQGLFDLMEVRHAEELFSVKGVAAEYVRSICEEYAWRLRTGLPVLG